MEKELKNESEELKNESEELKNESEELNVSIKENPENKRCEYDFCGANRKFIFGENNHISEELFGKLTEDLSLFFIIFVTSWCCFTEYDI
jgi:hypothetical protein